MENLKSLENFASEVIEQTDASKVYGGTKSYRTTSGEIKDWFYDNDEDGCTSPGDIFVYDDC